MVPPQPLPAGRSPRAHRRYLSTSNADRSPVRGALRRLAGRLVGGLGSPACSCQGSRSWRRRAGGPARGGQAALGHPDVPASVRTSSIPPILVAAGDEPWGRLTLIAFDEEGSAPAVVVKIGRHAEFDEATATSTRYSSICGNGWIAPRGRRSPIRSRSSTSAAGPRSSRGPHAAPRRSHECPAGIAIAGHGGTSTSSWSG